MMGIAAALASTIALATGAFGQACQVAGDCADQPCQTKACVNDECVYTAVVDGAGPNSLCATRCCSGVCCSADATTCSTENLCCVPNCAGRECGPDGCGRGGVCGTCPGGEICNADGKCNCSATTCPNGCCETASGPCQAGNTNQFCGSDGAACATCSGQQQCQNGQCACPPSCQGKQCGPDGCGGQCPPGCTGGQSCSAGGQCVGQATNECANLSDCTPVPADSWLVVPAGSNEAPNCAGTVLFCPEPTSPELELAIGSDYLLSGDVSPFKLYVTRWLGGPGDGLTSGGAARFFVVNFALVGVSIKPIVGCVAVPLTAAGNSQEPQLALGDGQQPQTVLRVREVELGPSRTAKYEHRCQPGERLVGGEPGVLFHKQEAPSAREIRQVKVVHRVTRDRVRVRIRTGAAVGDDERVTLQMIAHCRP